MQRTGKRRISTVAFCAAVTLAGGLQGTAGADAPRPAGPGAGPAPAAAPDFGASRADGTTFKDGTMSLGPAPAARRSVGAAPHGEGWQLDKATKLLASGYTIKFYDKKSADVLTRYVKASAADLQRVTNIRYTIDTKPVGWDYVRPRGEVVIGLLKRPCVPGATPDQPWKVVRDGSGTANLSCGFYSSSLPDTTTSGHAYIDSEFFTADGKAIPWMGETYLRSHISHELGHTMGLAHANRSEKRGDCAVGSDSGEKPVMCTPSDAYQDKRAGTYVQQFDVQGLRYLARGAGAALPPQGRVTGLAKKCLDVKGGKAANGTRVQLFTCNGGVAQSWILQKDGTFRALGKCLDNAGNVNKNGNRIQLSDCTGGPAQKWKTDAKGRIVHVASGKVLDVTGGRTANGTLIQLYTAKTAKGQVWSVPK
ncbi:ricin-type beta-trefoil lectin domain protein [Streptomyces sp. SCA2-4]|nr:ricin-type beta-trefoil lectin domain protein [Streptomyces huiliensis]